MTIINIMDVLDIREEWVNAYFLDMIARLVTKSTHTQLADEEIWLIEFAKNKVLEHNMLLIAASGQRPQLKVIEGGKKEKNNTRELHVFT
jgi:hypothetical protein